MKTPRQIQRDLGAVLSATSSPAEALREQDARLRSLIENLPDMVLVVDRDAVICFVNHGLPQAPPESLVGRLGFGFMVPEHQPACRDCFARALSTRQVHSVEVLDVFGYWWSARVVPLLEAGEIGHAMIICTDITEQKQAAEALRKERQLLRQLLDLHERDRQLIAYEIHDGFAQHLTAAMYNFEAFGQLHGQQSDEARKSFEVGIQLLGKGIVEARRLISGLRPPILDEFGIVAAIDYLVCEYREHSGREIEFHHDVSCDRLAPPLESAVFRIIQESLTNACRHSQSEKIRVELVQADNRIRIQVRDWGVGFDAAVAHENRFGLQGIRERIRLLGGQVAIVTAPGQGACITAELPLVEKRSE